MFIPNIRIGFGTDTHRLADGIPFVLGGIKIPHTKGLVGHSDADALLHAISDALFGALALRDIGFHFPDNASENKGRNSAEMLIFAHKLVNENGYFIANIDCTIQLQKPKLSDYIPQMCESIAHLLNVDISLISIKAKTGEGMGFVGREEGVEVQAIVLVHAKNLE